MTHEPEAFWTAITETPQPAAVIPSFAGALSYGVRFAHLPVELQRGIARMQKTYDRLRRESEGAEGAPERAFAPTEGESASVDDDSKDEDAQRGPASVQD